MVEIKTSETGIIVENVIKLTPKQAEKLGNALIVDEILNYAKDALNMVCMIRNPEVVLNLLLADSVNMDIISKAVETIVEASAKMRGFIKDLQIEEKKEPEVKGDKEATDKFEPIIATAIDSINQAMPDVKVMIAMTDGKSAALSGNLHPAIAIALLTETLHDICKNQ